MAGRDTSWAGASVAGESHETLYNWVHQGHDLPGLSDVHAGYAAQGRNIQEAAHDLGAAFNALLPYWRGQDADASARSVTRFAADLHKMGGQITEQAQTMTDVHRATVTVQQQITEPKTPSVGAALDGAAAGAGIGAIGGVPGMIAGAVVGGVADYNNQVAAAKAAEEQARRDYQAFLAATGAAASSAPEVEPPATFGGDAGFTAPPATQVGAPRNDVSQGAGGGTGPAGTSTQYAGPSGVGSQVAAAQLGGGAQAAPPPAGTPAATGTQYAPTTGAQGGGGFPGEGTGGAAGGAGTGGGASFRPGAGGAFGPSVGPGAGTRGGGSGGYRGGRGSGGFGPSGSRGAGGLGGADGSGRGSAGSGRGPSGFGGPPVEEAVTRAAGPAGARGAVGAGMMGAGAGAGRREGDREHKRPDYLVEDPEVWGEGVYVAPPVIGEDPDVYQQR